VLLETDGGEFDPQATAEAIVEVVHGRGFDLLLFGNESADSGGYQVPVRVAAGLGLPVVTGVEGIGIADGRLTARREAGRGGEVVGEGADAAAGVVEVVRELGVA